MQSKPITILLVDDDEDDYLILANLVSKIRSVDFSLEWESDPDAAAKKIAENTHDIYLIDYRLGPVSGIELISQFDIESRSQPFIILTGAGDSKIEESAMRIGVADYLVKGTFDKELLARVLRYSLQRKRAEITRIEHLKQINDSKDEFIALASHQLRTPATAVKQYVGMLLEGYAGELTDKQLTFLKSAYSSNERQLKVVDDILKIAQLDLQKLNLHMEVLDVDKFAAELEDDMQPIFADKNQRLSVTADTKGATCSGDRLHLGMAITNILDNASKYSHEDSDISMHVQQHDNSIQIIIRDQGVGIAPEDFEKLFIKFSRVPNPLSVIVGGTGLGLYWSNEVVKLHDGIIEVSSQPNKGTTFTVTLPALS